MKRKQIYLYLLTSALEGGSNYWVDHVDMGSAPEGWQKERDEYGGDWPWPQWLPTIQGGSVIITDEYGDRYTLRKSDLAKGYKIMEEKYPKKFAEIVTGNHDAITADVFLQCALFGSVVYG